MSGEAAARSTLDLPGRQEELIQAIKATGKPFAVVLFNGRPLALEDVVDDAPAILEAWFPACRRAQRSPTWCSARSTRAASSPSPSRAGSARCRSTTTTSRRAGRATPTQKYVSRHRDIPSCSPLFEFGHGLSYTTFEVSNLQLSSSTVSKNGSLTRLGDRDEHGSPQGRRGRAALPPRPGGQHLAARPPPARVRARDAEPGQVAQRHASRSTRATSASTTTAASSSSSQARSTSTPATAPAQP